MVNAEGGGRGGRAWGTRASVSSSSSLVLAHSLCACTRESSSVSVCVSVSVAGLWRSHPYYSVEESPTSGRAGVCDKRRPKVGLLPFVRRPQRPLASSEVRIVQRTHICQNHIVRESVV